MLAMGKRCRCGKRFKHQSLQGVISKKKGGKGFRTASASAYPPRFCEDAAGVILKAAQAEKAMDLEGWSPLM